MSYETIQTALTAFINVTAIAGFTGIIAHAIWTSHCNWMTQYCPTVGHSNPEVEPLTENLQIEIFHLAGSGEAICADAPNVATASLSQQRFAIAPEPEDIWSETIATSSPRYWVRQTPPQQPTLYLLPPAREEVKPVKKSRKTAAKPKSSVTSKRKKVA